MLLPATYFLAPTATVSFFPSYLIGILGLASIYLHWDQLAKVKTSISFLAGLFFILLISVQFGSGEVATTALYFGYCLLILTFVLGYLIAAEKVSWFTTLFMLTIVGSTVVSCAISIYFYFALDYQPLVENRLYALGRLNNPVISAISYGSVFCLCLAYISTSKETALRLLTCIVALIILYAIGLTESRGTWLGISAAAVSIFLLREWHSKYQMVIASTVVFGLLLISVTLLLATGYSDVLMRRSMSFRPEIWSESISLWWNGRTILGAGMHTVAHLEIGPNTFHHPHSIYVSTLYHGGVAGLAAFLLLIIRMFWIARFQADKEIRSYAFPLFVFGLTTLLFDGNKLIEKVDFIWLCLWLPIALMLVAETRFRQPTR